jgi:hypothetical protein
MFVARLVLGCSLTLASVAWSQLHVTSDVAEPEPPWLYVEDAELLKALDPVKPGPVEASITVRLAAPTERPARRRE